jgi:DNA polymerase-4
VTLKVKFADFEIITRSRSVSTVIANRDDLAHLAIGLLEDNIPLPKAVRLLGVSLSSLQDADDAEPQLDFGI